MRALLMVTLLVFGGCDVGTYRNRPHQQIEDFKLCKSAGIGAALNAVGEVMCLPPKD